MKRIICTLISALMIISFFAFPSAAADKSGTVFAVDEFYRTAKRLDKHPHTYEAWVKVAKNAPASELGVVAGNYTNGKNASYGFEIRKNGNPFLWMGYGGSGTDQRLSFDKVDLRTGEWTHVAVTFDSTTAYCYVNGELKQTLSAKLPDVDMTRTDVLCIGGDLRSGNGRWLKSTELSSVALYSDMRTEAEIRADMAQIALDDADILAARDYLNAIINEVEGK